MANFYLHTYLLVLLFRLSNVLSALYPTQPVADTVFFCGDSALITWTDTRHKPHVAALGDLTIKLYTSEDDYVTTIASGVNPASYSTQVILPLDLRNDTLYVLRFSAPGLWEDVWTADFTISPESSGLTPNPRLQSLSVSPSPLGESPTGTFPYSTPGLTQSSSTKETAWGQTASSALPAATLTPDSIGSSSPPRTNGAVYSRADQLDQARFRLLFIAWPALFGLSMAL